MINIQHARFRVGQVGLIALIVAALLAQPAMVIGASKEEIDRDVSTAIEKLYATTPEARTLSGQATAVLVFPSILKAGFIVGAQYGEGALRKAGTTVGYYSALSGSYGLQAGVQSFGYAMFFMSPSALTYLDRSGGWEIGTGPSIVILDKGKAAALTTTSARNDVYVMFFDQKGLMAGLGLQGSKISKIER